MCWSPSRVDSVDPDLGGLPIDYSRVIGRRAINPNPGAICVRGHSQRLICNLALRFGGSGEFCAGIGLDQCPISYALSGLRLRFGSFRLGLGGGCEVARLCNQVIGLSRASLHLIQLPLHHLELSVVYPQSTNANERQNNVYQEGQLFKHSEFSRQFTGCVFVSFAFIMGVFGHFSFFYSGLRWKLRKRLMLGFTGWLIAVLLAIHGFSLNLSDFGFRPSAFGFPARGESSFAVRTLWSSSAFGTFRIFRMMPLNFLNSDVSRNCSGVSVGGSTSSQDPAQSAFQSLTPTTTPWGYLSERDTQPLFFNQLDQLGS